MGDHTQTAKAEPQKEAGSVNALAFSVDGAGSQC